jgi:PAS domain S-box-containing protein
MRNKAKRKSVKRELLRSSGLLALSIIIAFGLLFSGFLYLSEMGKARAVLRHANQSAQLFVEGVFRETINTISVLEDDPEIRNGAILGADARERVLMKYQSFARANPEILFVYSGYADRSMIIDPLAWEVPEGYDPTIRPWYTAAMQTKPEIAIGVPYQEYTSGQWVISTSKALMQHDGDYGGVVSIELAIDEIVSILLEFSDYETGQSFVLGDEGTIILHQDASLLGASDSWIKAAVTGAEQGSFAYRSGSEPRLAHFRRVPLTGWVIVTDVVRREMLLPIPGRVAGAIGVTAVVALLVALLQSVYLSRRFNQPLVELRSTVRAVIAGETEHIGDYQYPDNEIGDMAAEIGRLAEGEIHARTRALRESEEKLRMFFSQSLAGFFFMMLDEPVDWNGADEAEKERLLDYTMSHQRITRVNQALADQYGAREEDLIGLTASDLFAHDLEQGRRILEGVFEKGSWHVETRERRLDGTSMIIEGDYTCLYDDQGRVTGHFGVQSEITGRKHAEEEIARQLAAKETLLREVHHRVKNNISVIKGLLSLQAGNAASEEARAALEDALSRVQSMSELYDRLLLTGEYRDVSMKAYVEGLVAHIFEAYPESGRVTVETRVDDFSMDPKKAVSLGIVLNELVTNTLKYAFPGGECGSVLISLDHDGRTAILTVQDDGVGFAGSETGAAGSGNALPPTGSTGFGLTLVGMLAEQLKGSFAMEGGDGTTSRVTFEA